MFLTETDLINLRLTIGSKLNDSEIVEALLKDDILSPQKQLMKEGEKYYVCEHDVLQKDFRKTIISEGENEYEDTTRGRRVPFVNPNRSNHHNVNPFHKILVDQKASYLIGREPTISVIGAEKNSAKKAYEGLLSEFADEGFNELLSDWVIGASNKGFECVHVYYDEAGEFRYNIAPANEIIPIYDSVHETDLQEVVRYYDITVIKGKEKYIRKRVEWWTKTDVTYYTEIENKRFIKDTERPYNPAPHWWDITKLNGFEKRREKHSWGRVPFIILRNNSKSTTDLQAIKGLIDAYDLLSSEGTNNFLDLVELYWVIQGYGGETANAIAERLRINRAVHVNDSAGKVEAKQVSLPVEGRIAYLEMLRRDIYHFGQGIDTDSEKFGNAPSGVSLKFRYTLLDLKANALSAKLKKAIKELLWFYTDHCNRQSGTDYSISDIQLSINKTMITNDLETVQMIAVSKGIVSDKTLLSKHPFVDDINAELIELEQQEEQNIKKYAEYQNLGDGGAE